MSRKDAKPHFAYILDTLDIIAANTPKSLDSFMNDPNAQDATLMRLQDIGEHLVHIRDQFPDFYTQQQDESWNKLIGLRNIISHGYREIDFAIIWDIVNGKLDEFTKHIREVVNKL